MAVSAGSRQTCAVDTSGSFDCWGLYNSTYTPRSIGPVSAISAGLSHTCAVQASTGVLSCWLATGGSDTSAFATQPGDCNQSDARAGYKMVSAGAFHTCAVNATDNVCCWGTPSKINDYSQSRVPESLKGEKVLQVSAGRMHTCVVLRNGTTSCWGSNEFSQAVVPANLATAIDVSAGRAHSCALTAALQSQSGTVRCWGDSRSGQTSISAAGVTAMGTGEAHTCVVAGGRVQCTGAINATVPAGLSGSSINAAGSTAVAVSAGVNYTCVVLNKAASPGEQGWFLPRWWWWLGVAALRGVICECNCFGSGVAEEVRV